MVNTAYAIVLLMVLISGLEIIAAPDDFDNNADTHGDSLERIKREDYTEIQCNDADNCTCFLPPAGCTGLLFCNTNPPKFAFCCPGTGCCKGLGMPCAVSESACGTDGKTRKCEPPK